MVLRGIERSDQGCGGGGGKDSADVLRLAGLTFITNANTQPHSSSEACTAAVRSKRAPTMEEKNKKSLEYGPAKPCCEQGMRYSPKSRTCLEFATQRFPKNPVCRRAFSECCDWLQKYLSKGQDQGLYLARHDMGADFDLAPSLVRSYFPESWMWEVQPISRGQTVLSRPLPDSLTTWQLRAVGVFNKGVCVADSVQVAVSLPLSVDVPLPYQVVRGEQVKLRGSVYNQEPNTISFCVTLTVGPGICLLQSHLVAGGAGLHSTSCNWAYLPPGGVGEVAFVVMGLHHGEHTLTFTLKTRDGARDILEKTLRVVPEGVRQEVNSGGTLDPQGLYGSERRTVLLKNHLPAYMVPHTPVERLLTIHGEILGEVVNLVLKAEGVQQLVNLPAGSAQAELGSLLPLVLVYQYLETTRSWEILKGGTIQENSAELRRKIREGLVSLSSFRRGDSSYSMWMKRESSTWLTALVVRTMAEADQIMSVDHQTLSDSVNWLIRKNQNPDGSFVDRSSFSPNRAMAAGADAVAQSVYLTSFVLIALKTATSINDPILQLRSHDESMSSAVQYISQHASGLKSVYVRAVATYALTLQDPNSMTASQLFSSLEKLARQKESLGRPVLRYWQESSVAADWLKLDQSSGETVEMTAYVLLTALLKGRVEYANPILAWLTQDQYYGEGFYSNQDTVLTLKALTEYSRVIPRAVLNQDINIRFGTIGEVHRVSLSQSHPVATPIQVTTNQDISVITGYGRGVSNVKLKTVYYRTTASTQTRCNFELNIEVFGSDTSTRPGLRAPHLVACVKYKPPPNELYTESTLTLMKIQLPTGLEAYLEDLRQFTDLDEPIISHYELQENTLIIQLDSVPSDIFQCVGFRIRTSFQVDGSSQSLFTVSEPQDKGSLCSRQFSYQEQNLQRLCVAEQCQCMTGVCASYRGTVDGTLTPDRRTNETCRPEVRYAYKVKVASTAAEGDFMTFKATVVEVLKNTDGALVAVSSGTEVELVKKSTCSEVELQKDKTYLLLGARGSEVIDGDQTRYRFPLDSDALVELLPTDCSSPECLDYISQLEDFTLDLQLSGCP